MSVLRRNNVTTSGGGKRTIIFSHGFGCDLTVWRDVAPAFADDWRVVLFDHVGAGASDVGCYDPAKYSGLHGYAQDVLDIMAALDLENAVFVGHSVSAMIGMLAAIEQPQRFGSMVMICPSPCYIDQSGYVGGFSREDIDGLLDTLDRNFVAWARATAPGIMGNPDRPHLANDLGSSFCRMDPRIARAFARVTFLSDHREDVPKLTTNSLIMQTHSDMIAPVSVGRYMADHLQHGTFALMQATGHCPHMSAPAETIDLIRHFLAA